MSLCPINHPMMHVVGMVGWVFPSLVVEEQYMDRVFPVLDKLSMFVEETGYCHIQATKPDTVGEWNPWYLSKYCNARPHLF